MKYSRILRGRVRDFFETSSPTRDYIANYVLDNLKNGTKSVALCFRGNAATLYYRCHQLLRIRSSRDGIVGEFDFRHARYSENYKLILERLNNLHVDTSRFCGESGHTSQSIIRFSLEKCNIAEVKEILEIYRGLIDDFFNTEKKNRVFGAPIGTREKSFLLEKDRQQQLWASYFLNDSLTFYDLEYSERFAAQNGIHGRFDLLGLRREKSGYTLLLTELKSSSQALKGKSGIEDHERDYLAYLGSSFVAVRKTEACETIRLFCNVFGKPYPPFLAPETITEVKVQFVFSDNVVGAGKAYRPLDSRIEKAYLETASPQVRLTDEKPSLRYTILRGKDKIGENLIEIAYGDTKLLVELGKALDGGEELSDIEKTVLQEKYDAVVVSHYHADHSGLIEQKKDCPIYVGAGARRILQAIDKYNGKTLPNNIVAYQSGKPFHIGEIEITPFLCDHSAFDSYMLLLKAGGKSILYTGDFRFHGRKNSNGLFACLPDRVDTLISEGTNIGSDKPCFSERELEERAVELFSTTDKPIFVLQSASNIDRIVSIYRAAKRSGRIFYEDIYTAMLAKAAGGGIPRPDNFEDVYVFTPWRVQGKRKDMLFEFEQKRGVESIAKGKPFVMLVRPSMLNYLRKIAEKINLNGAYLIYSLWSGYREHDDVKTFLTQAQALGLIERTLHTSGHASQQDIERLKERVSASEYVFVHTASNI